MAVVVIEMGEGGGTVGSCVRWLWLPGQRGPTQAPLTVPHKFQAPLSTSKHKVQGCLSTKRDSFQTGSFAF